MRLTHEQHIAHAQQHAQRHAIPRQHRGQRGEARDQVAQTVPQRATVEARQQQRPHLRERKHGLEVKKTELDTRKQGLEKELETIRSSATTSISRSASLKGLVQNLERTNQDDQALVLGIERSIRQLEGEIESTREEIEAKREDLEALNRKLVEVETAREVTGESGYGRAAEAIT